MERALRLPQVDEPLVTDLAEDIASGSYVTRQMRRKARRAEAKAARRRGMQLAADLPEVEPACEAETEPQQDAWLASTAEEVEAQPEAPWITAIPQAAEFEHEAPWAAITEAAEMERDAPAALPAIEPAQAAPLLRSRALARPPSGLAARLGAWFARLVPRPAAALERRDPDALAEQMLVLRTELALVQMRLDRMIAATSA
ncbi:MAG: hypothetical protein JF595_15965 [Sphingomonadales bacterium]|nr:hypothetical protein [Sphingomonadales bacterium]